MQATVLDTYEKVNEMLNSFEGDIHPHAAKLPLMDVRPVLAIAFGYFAVVWALMKLIAYRGKGFDLKPIVLVHNLCMCLLSAFMCVATLAEAWSRNYSLFGNGVDPSPLGEPMARIVWLFYFSKIFEFIDTIIMALRYRFRQITFLHVYHHSSIFLTWWYVVRKAPGGESYFTCALNSFVHIVMYGYYFWSSVTSGRRDPKASVTWTSPAFYRPYITRLQMGQFMVMVVQAVYDYVVPSPYPKEIAGFLFIYMISMLTLFGNFYMKSYRSAKAKKKMEMKEA